MKSLKFIKVLSFCIIAAFILFLVVRRQSEEPEGIEFRNGQIKPAADLSGHIFAKRSIRFEPNMGQTNIPASYIARGKGYNLFLKANEAEIAYQTNINQIQLVGTSPGAAITGCDELSGKTHYFIGSNPADWLTDIPNYARVVYKDVYQGIDLAFYGNEGELEYDFIVAPGADPSGIRLKFDGQKKPRLKRNGSLVIPDGKTEMIMKQPFAYQMKEGIRETVPASFSLKDNGQVGFNVGEYDPEYALVIDPVLLYSTYLGTNDFESGDAIAVDGEGCAYVTGSTNSLFFPVASCFQCTTDPGGLITFDAFVTKFNAEGTDIIYSTYIGGSYDDSGASIAVDNNGRAYITGRTSSKDNPATPKNEGFPLMNAYQPEIGSANLSDAFVTVLSPAGSSLIYSSYLGGDGEDYGTGIAVYNDQFVFVTGTEFSFDFPVKSAFMGTKPSYYYDAFVSKFDTYASGEASLIYSTHLGGGGDDYSNSIAVDRQGCAYVTGKTVAADFPVTNNVIQKTKKLNNDVFVTKLAADGLSLVYSTFLGSDGYDNGLDIKVDTAGYAFVNGIGANGFPTTSAAFNKSGGSFFLCRILPDGSSFSYSTFSPAAGSLAIDNEGQAYIGSSVADNAYMAAFNRDGSDTLFTLKLTGNGSNNINDIAVDKERSIYITGNTSSTNIATKGAYKTTLSGSSDIMVAKFGRSKDLIAEVFQDSLKHKALPVPSASFEIYSVDLTNHDKPLNFIEARSTDAKGFLHLPADNYHPGMPLLIRSTPEKRPAVKRGTAEKDKLMYEMHLDNLIINKDGTIDAQKLKSDAADTTKVYLSHTSLGFNLSVSAEWKISPDYLNNLKSAFAKASNLMYDVTNGQACIDFITVYDDTTNWRNSDIRIYADNMQWPESAVKGMTINGDGYVSLPPALYDSTMDFNLVQKFYDANPVDPSNTIFVPTIVHELGHYAFGFFDEYIDPLGIGIYPAINFGIMDYHYPGYLPMNTELSDYIQGDDRFNIYTETYQYFYNDHNCWDYFKGSFDHDYGLLLARIHTPKELGIHPPGVMKGPNDNLNNPDFSVGSMMKFSNKAVTTALPTKNFRFKEKNTGKPVVMKVCLEKNGSKRWIIHGYTTLTGEIRLFNAEAGDRILASHGDGLKWKYIRTVVGNPSKKGTDDEEIVEVNSVDGQFALLPGITFNAQGNPVYQCQADPSFISPPSMRLEGTEEQVLTGTGGAYSIPLSNPAITRGLIYFSAPDNHGENFFVFQNALVKNVQELGDSYYSPEMQLKLAVNQSQSTAKKVSVLASGFPTPTAGLPQSMLRVSDVVSINTFPAGSLLKGHIQIRYFTDSLKANSSKALTIYRWNDGWTPLETRVDLTHNTVNADINGSGYFAAFIDLKQASLTTGIQDVKMPPDHSGFHLYPVYPNPSINHANIRFELPFGTKARLEIADLNGQKVITLLDRFMAAGDYTEVWACIDNKGKRVKPGVYFCLLTSGTVRLYQKIVVTD